MISRVTERPVNLFHSTFTCDHTEHSLERSVVHGLLVHSEWLSKICGEKVDLLIRRRHAVLKFHLNDFHWNEFHNNRFKCPISISMGTNFIYLIFFCMARFGKGKFLPLSNFVLVLVVPIHRPQSINGSIHRYPRRNSFKFWHWLSKTTNW